MWRTFLELLLKMSSFLVQTWNRPYIVYAFPNDVLHSELPKGMQTPKFTKFSGGIWESII
jgi:hypothetical protein